MRQIFFALAILWAGAAHASQITILSIDSRWEVQNVVDTYDRNRNANLTGDKTNEIRWGESFRGNQPRSGFRFKETAVGKRHNANTRFDVGVFTHMNRVIFQGEHVDEARLNMSVRASFFDGKEQVERTFETSYLFSLLETPNYQNPTCANDQKNGVDGLGNPQAGGSTLNQNGCADRVRLLKNDALTDEFTHNGLTYEFELFGFDSGAEFWTIEDLDNDTWLKARFNVTGQPPVPPVPLPAGAWLLIAALGGLGALRRMART